MCLSKKDKCETKATLDRISDEIKRLKGVIDKSKFNVDQIHGDLLQSKNVGEKNTMYSFFRNIGRLYIVATSQSYHYI